MRAVLEEGRPQVEVAEALDLKPQTLSRWVIAAKAESSRPVGTREPLARQDLEPLFAAGKLGSQLVGRVARYLRKNSSSDGTKSPSAEMFGAKVGIKPSTLRGLETGRALPDAAVAYALAKACDLNLTMAVLLFALARCHDECESLASIDDLFLDMRKEDSRFGFVLDTLVVARSYDDPEALKEYFDRPAIQDRVHRLLRTASKSAQAGVKTFGDELFSRVSPVLLDMLYGMSERLRLFHPALDESALDTWEHANRERIRQVVAFYTEPLALGETIDSFKCTFLNYSAAPVRYVIVLKGATKAQAEEAKNKIVRKTRNLPKTAVVVKAVDAKNPEVKALEASLWFDSATSMLCSEDAGRGALKMRTLNLYELILGDPNSQHSGQFHCAFVDNRPPPSRAQSRSKHDSVHFTRALNLADVEQVRKRLLAVLTNEGIEL